MTGFQLHNFNKQCRYIFSFYFELISCKPKVRSPINAMVCVVRSGSAYLPLSQINGHQTCEFGSAIVLTYGKTIWPAWADPEGGDRGSGSPLKNHTNKKNIGFLNNIGSDPLKIHKATKPAFNVVPSSARQ